MATAPEAAMMDMPQEAAPNPFSDPNTMAVYDQMRQTVSPKEFGDEMLAGAAQTSPEEVAAFRSALEQIEMPPEALDLLNNMVDEILANPEQYAEIRAKYKEMDAPDEILPEQFDPEFFAALNMAVDQMIAAPAGVRAFAQGGIAELKPVAKAIADYGRNGDTMLAHITPAEARMLRRRGGSGTINPDTGLPEFFLKGLFKGIGKALKSVGNAVKKFASSTVGKIVTTVALGFFLGPAAASFMGVGSAAGVAAVSGFVGSAGSTLLAGGNLKDALKAGAVGGLTAGAIGGVTQGFNTAYAGPTTISGQVDAFNKMISPSAAAPAPSISSTGEVANQIPVEPPASDAFTAKKVSLVPGPDGTLQPPPNTEVRPFTDASGKATSMGTFPTQNPYDPATATRAADYGWKPTSETSFLDKAKTFYNENLSPSGIQQQGAGEALKTVQTQFPNATPDQIMNAAPNSVLGKAYAAAMPGIMSTYGPITAAGIGAIGAFGGFKPSNPDPSTLKPELLKTATQRIEEQGKQKEYYVQGLPGVQYDEKGAPVYGQYTPLPTYEAPNFAGNYSGGISSLPNSQMYTPPPGVVGGNAPVYQPYNTASMYSNLVPRRYEEGGTVKLPTAEEKAAADKAAADKAAALAASQAANREAVRRQEEQQRAAGFGNAYANINAGLAYNAPSSMPAQVMAPDRTAGIKQLLAKPNMTDAEIFAGMQKSSYTPAEVAQATGVSFGDINRRYNVASQEAQFNPAAQAAQYRTANEAALGFRPATAAPVAKPAAVSNVLNPAIAQDLMYRSMSPGGAPTSSFTQYGGYDAVNDMATKAGFQPSKQWMNSYKPTGNGIASLAAGGYPRRTGQISGPGTPTSDSIPAMLSDGEFVMTEKAVRGAGKGDRRAGAKRMYALMNQLEKNAARG